MAELENLSGPWQGWWVQGAHRGHQRLNLLFGEGKIMGSGGDDSGQFDVFGEYDEGDVWLVKRYLDWDVRYNGKWDGAMISGYWTIQSHGYFDSGSFEIWPVKGEETTSEVEAALQASN